MSCESETAELLRAAGQKLTPQRLLISATLRHSRGHHTAQQIFETVRKTYPYVDLSTVYRTLTALRKLRLVAETDLGSGDASYEWLEDGGHHHLVCRSCGGVQQVEAAQLDSLAAELKSVYGFEADLQHFAVFGRCAACAVTKS